MIQGLMGPDIGISSWGTVELKDFKLHVTNTTLDLCPIDRGPAHCQGTDSFVDFRILHRLDYKVTSQIYLTATRKACSATSANQNVSLGTACVPSSALLVFL